MRRIPAGANETETAKSELDELRSDAGDDDDVRSNEPNHLATVPSYGGSCGW